MKLSTKVYKSISKYLGISKNYVISIGIYDHGKTSHITLKDNLETSDELYYFDIGSISKTFTAHLILKLVEENQLNLDDSIDKYLELKPGKYPTIRQCLSHRCGCYNLTPCSIVVTSLLKHRYSRKNIYENITYQDVISKIKQRKRPEYKYSYSDFPFAVLACIVSKIENESFGEIMHNFIRDELKLNSTSVSYKIKRNLYGFDRDHQVNFWKWNKDNPYLSGGGIVSNIEDMVNYIKIQIESNEFYIKNAHIPMANIGHIVPCLAWHTYEKSNQLWHVGGAGTFRSSIIINKQKKKGVIVLGNAKGVKSGNVHYICKQIYSEMKRNKIKID